ncbi:DNA ligase [termite gut metagenome]|uniref:DNA ligase n=1 Tax=termite gut metagenome TaxID=433724 RepID=A0A5J4QYA8_9ZZZZ
MISGNRLFQKVRPDRDAKIFYIFCEGSCRENEYFNYFTEISSKIKLEIIPPNEHQTSPDKLYQAAYLLLIETEDNSDPKYELTLSDEVWFVIDTDEWKDKIGSLLKKCQKHSKWVVAQSNPCFEVWLYYHLHQKKPSFKNMNISKEWKTFVNNSIAGGFDSRKHPIHIESAINNAKCNYSDIGGEPDIACTEVFKLAERFYPFINSIVKEKIDQLRTALHRHNYNYYVLNAPVISDKEFDDRMRELQELEQATADEFCSFNVPEAALRGLAKRGSSRASLSSFNFSNTSHGINISPRISKRCG